MMLSIESVARRPLIRPILAMAASITLMGAPVNAQTTANPTPDPQIAAAKAATELANALKAQSDAEKAAYDSAAAAAKARMGDIPSSGYSGTADASGTAGGTEALLLGAVAINRVAAQMAVRLKSDVPASVSSLMLYASASIPDFQALMAFNAQREGLKRAFEAAAKSTKEAEQGESLATSVGTVGLGLDAINKLLGYFKTDYKFLDLAVASSDAMLVTALAAELRKQGLNAQMPSTYLPPTVLDGEAFLKPISEVFDWSEQAHEKQLRNESEASRTKAKMAKALKDKADADVTQDQTRLSRLEDAAAIWKAVAERIDGFIKASTTASDKGIVPLALVVQQSWIRSRLDQGAVLVVVQLHKVAGTAYTKKNIWSSLGANPFFVMGGAVAGMTALAGNTGQVLSSAFIPWHGGYRSVSEVEDIVNATAPK
jgi:hypothetical protein